MKQVKFLSALSFILTTALTFSSGLNMNIDAEGDKSITLESSINPISGDYIIDEVDLIANGIEPIVIKRVYSSGMQKGKQPYWQLMPHTTMHLDKKEYENKEKRVSVCEPSGMRITYKNFVCEKENGRGKDRYTFVPMLGGDAKGITNTSRGPIGASTNIQNNFIRWLRHDDLYVLTTCDGTERFYKRTDKITALLQKEHKPNGNWVFYEYKNNRPSLVYTTNPAQDKVYVKVTFDDAPVPSIYAKDNLRQRSYATKDANSNEVHYIYHISKEKEDDYSYLNTVVRPTLPDESYYYGFFHNDDETALIKRRSLDNHTSHIIDYYTPGKNHVDGETFNIKKRDHAHKKVKTLKQPVGPLGEMHTTQTLMYFTGKYDEKEKLKHDDVYTLSFDVYKEKTECRFDSYFRPTFIKKYKGGAIASSQEMVWHDKQKGSLLTQKGIRDETCALKQLTHYIYDTFGNITTEMLYGNLTGTNHAEIDLHLSLREQLHEKKLAKLSEKANSDPRALKKKQQLALREQRIRERKALLNERDGKNRSLGPRKTTDSYSITYTYDDSRFHLLRTKALPNGTSYEYSYKQDTNLLVESLTLDNGRIRIREYFTYNDDNILIEKIVDDGSSRDKQNVADVKTRKVTKIHPKKSQPALNYPEVIVEQYYDRNANTLKLLKKTKYIYSKDCDILKEEVFDADGLFSYKVENIYDAKRRLIKTIDPLGRVTTFKHNNLNQVTNQSSETLPYKIEAQKDILGRPTIGKKIYNDGSSSSIKYFHDLKSRLYKTIDEDKNVTHITYDALGHEIKRVLPKTLDETGNAISPTIQTINDFAGRPIKVIDPMGRVITSTYNARSQPTKIHYPDGSCEAFEYYVDGNLKIHTTLNGNKIVYAYDFLSRITQKKIFSRKGKLLQTEQSKYDSFNLIEHADADGSTTLYLYDGLGRKTEEFKLNDGTSFEKIRYRFEYDSLGRVYKTIKNGNTDQSQIFIQEFDLANRVIEEHEEDENGKVYSKTEYEYDRFNNKTCIIKRQNTGTSREIFTYDGKSRPLTYANALGETTHFEYIENIENPKTNTFDTIKITTDPLGRKVKEHFSSLGSLLSKTLINSFGTTQGEELYFYDLSGNRVKQINKIYSGNEIVRESTTLWEYDTKSRPIKIVEAFGEPIQKNTYISYTIDGKEKTVTAPNGTTVSFAYDALGQLIDVLSSDRTIHYQFTYDNAGRIIKEDDLIQNRSTVRTFNTQANTIEEILANGFSLKKEYDDFGRQTTLTLFDDSTIVRTYDTFHLLSVERSSPDNASTYVHRYLEYSLDHQPLLQSYANDVFEGSNTFDILGRHTSTSCSHYTQEIKESDPCGNIKAKKTTLHRKVQDSTYEYDDLDHLIKESGKEEHQYVYDSQHNRISKNNKEYSLNALNQVTDSASDKYHYDANGNRKSTLFENKHIEYVYDALERLTKIQTDKEIIEYLYDASHRRLSKKIKQKKTDNSWETQLEELYIYDDEVEIGAAGPNKYIKHLRIIGLSKGGDIAGAVAIESNGSIYIPIHDLSGNIVSIFGLASNRVEETIEYTCFGEATHYDSNGRKISRSAYSPWGYQSKRSGPETNLIFFGRRYYDPIIGSWISPDPNGLSEGPSLYQALMGNPLKHTDLWGLSIFDPDKEEIGGGWPDKDNPFNDRYPLRPCLGNNVLIGNPEYTYTPMQYSTFPKHTDLYLVNSQYRQHPELEVYFLNGMSTKYKEALSGAISISNELKHSVNLLHNKSHGFLDSFDIFQGHLNIKIHAARKLEHGLRASLVNPMNKAVLVIAHSEGADILRNAIKDFDKSLRKKLFIYTFGAAHYIPNMYGERIVNYSSKGDIVSIINNSIHYLFPSNSIPSLSRLGALGALPLTIYRNASSYFSFNNVTFLEPNSMNPLKEHAFLGETYKKRMIRVCETIKKEFGI